MAEVLESTRSEAGTAVFELDRFEPTADARIELDGYWFGVRGRRFVRPMLTLAADGERCRLLADLDHKPWPAADGETWHAVFPWEFDGEAITEVELSVAPDIAVALPAPGGEAPPRSRASTHGTRHARSEAASLRRELEHLRRELEQERADAARRLEEERNSAASLLEEERRAVALRLEEEQRAGALKIEQEQRAGALRLEEERRAGAARLEEARREHDRRLEPYRHEIDRLHADGVALRKQLDTVRGEAADARSRHDLARQEAQRLAAALEAHRAAPEPERLPSPRHPVAAPAAAEVSAHWPQRLLALTVLIGVLLALALMTRLL